MKRLICLTVLCFSVPAFAQSSDGPTRFNLGGMFIWALPFSTDTNNYPFGAIEYIGWDLSVSGNLIEHFALEGDVSGNYHRSSVSAGEEHYYSFAGGPRFTFPNGRLTPYLHFLVGSARGTTSALGLSIPTHSLSLVLMPGGGMDIKLHRHLALRAFQVDYLALHSSGASNLQKVRLGGGAVVRF